MTVTLHLQAHLKHLEEATMTQSVLLSVVSHITLSTCLIWCMEFYSFCLLLRFVCMSERTLLS
jgi:hypothetical protein